LPSRGRRSHRAGWLRRMKLDARDRAQLVMIAYETGVVMPGTT
jgi:hypothetical protein